MKPMPTVASTSSPAAPRTPISRSTPFSLTPLARQPLTRPPGCWTSTAKHIIVIWEEVQDNPLTAYPVTAYEVPPLAIR
jgi:hypothetical protein